MFGKSKNDTIGSQTSPDDPPPRERRRSVLQGVAITGDLSSNGIIDFDGTLIGDLTADTLVLARSGRIEGTVRARIVTIEGVLDGSVIASHVAIKTAAKVTADITCHMLSIESSAEVKGHFSCTPETPNDQPSGSDAE